MTRIYDESYAKRFKKKFDELWTKGELFLWLDLQRYP
jgi:hypothetical protein